MYQKNMFTLALIVCQSTCHGLLFNVGGGNDYVESNYVFKEHLMCEDLLWETRNEIKCEDGRPLNSKGCCPPVPGSNKPVGSVIGCPYIHVAPNGKCTYSGCEKYKQFKKSLKMSIADRWVGAHNVFRCMHGLPDVKWNSDTAGYAQFWADKSSVMTGKGKAGECTMQHSKKTYKPDDPMWSPGPRKDGKAGENLAYGVGRPQEPEFSTQQWYEEINYYRGVTLPPKNGKAVGHYTAMMWRDNREIGCGTCRGPVTNSGGRYGYHDVCQYSKEPSNYGLSSKYAQQVPQNNDPVQTEEFCCKHAYSRFIGSSNGPDPTTKATTTRQALRITQRSTPRTSDGNTDTTTASNNNDGDATTGSTNDGDATTGSTNDGDADTTTANSNNGGDDSGTGNTATTTTGKSIIDTDPTITATTGSVSEVADGASVAGAGVCIVASTVTALLAFY